MEIINALVMLIVICFSLAGICQDYGLVRQPEKRKQVD